MENVKNTSYWYVVTHTIPRFLSVGLTLLLMYFLECFCKDQIDSKKNVIKT